MVRWSLPVARLVLVMLLAVACQGARADTAIRLLKSYVGNVNFVGTQITVRDKGNKKACHVFNSSEDRTAKLSGIPDNATILSAHLYWAGSNNNPDFNVVMDGAAVSAEDGRRYYSTTIGNGFNYYSGAADVTEQVKKKGNGDYKFRGLTVDKNAPYCSVEGVLGGFSLLVIYSHANQPFRMLNLYEGFQYMRYGGFTLNLSGFRVPDPVGTATGRIGHITWEGDGSLESFGENLTFNNYEMTDSRNPSGNQFNSKSSINGDDFSYGIDFDAYTLGYPVIKSGQTTATTRYESGQDLVLLSAEVVALPNVPMADLSIAMQLHGELAQGRNADYTVRVANAGPSVASSPTVVSSTLPAGLTYVSASGDGWTCTSIGQDVTCSNTSALPAGAQLAALTLQALVTGTGTITMSALVTGKTYDPQTANNAVSVNATVLDGSAAFVLTAGACEDGLAFDHPDQKCTKVLPEVRAGLSKPIFITAVSEGVPAGPSEDTTVSMRFALSCHNPQTNAGVKALYAGQTLELCSSNGTQPVTWSGSSNIEFKAKKPSVEKLFTYGDVGLVQLFMLAGPGPVLGGAPFVSVPEIRLSRKNGVALAEASLDEKSVVFAKAGDPFELEVGAYIAGAQPKLAPNFGNETPPVTFASPKIDKGAIADSKAWDDMVFVPGLKEEGKFSGTSRNLALGTFSWPEVGVLKLTPALSSSAYLGAPFAGKDGYGRFIPHHFTTSAQQMDCVPNMKCELDANISTAAYSRERISVTVAALANGNTATKNYRGVFARDVALSALAGAAKDQDNSANLKDRAVAAAAFKNGDGTAQVLPKYELPNAFVHSAPQAAWSAPTSIYLRAAEVGGDGLTSAGASAYEVGIRIVSGRLLVPNAHGSERLNLPLKLSAQYWTGTNWELSRNDKHNIIDPAKALFSNFGGLALTLVPATPKMLADGVAGFSVKGTPAAAGKADLVIDHLEWLPSTKGRLKFGTYKSPLIYLRELH